MRTLQIMSALLLYSLVAVRSQCAHTDSPQLRFVAQLSVSGCALFVHDTGASDGPHLAIEPVMCVTDNPRELALTFDEVISELYVNVPVTLRDAGMLEEARRQLQHLSPRSVSFMAVSNINVSTKSSTAFDAEAFLWSPAESVGALRLRNRAGQNMNSLFLNIRSGPAVALSSVILSAVANMNGSCSTMHHQPVMQNQSFFDLAVNRPRYTLPACRQLRFARFVNLENCTARVHQRLDIKGHFLIEPLLCFNISSLSSESDRYDYIRDKHYLKLDLVLQDDASLDAVRTQLADLSPRSVEFMRLWRAESIVSSLLSTRYEIGPLMVSADWRSAQLRLFCRHIINCHLVRFVALSNPADLWRHIKWHVTSMMGEVCIVKSDQVHFSWRMRERSGPPTTFVKILSQVLSAYVIPQRASVKKFIHERRDGRLFVKIQQRVSGNVSFQRSWREYENGFGDETDFWIGLSAIHSLSAGGATLRVEMKNENGTHYAEYAGFQVEDASSKYLMTYRQMLRDRSNISYDPMEFNKGMRFSTMDRDNDEKVDGSCSNQYGKGGWWFGFNAYANPNGLFPSSKRYDLSYMTWYGRLMRGMLLLLEV